MSTKQRLENPFLSTNLNNYAIVRQFNKLRKEKRVFSQEDTIDGNADRLITYRSSNFTDTRFGDKPWIGGLNPDGRSQQTTTCPQQLRQINELRKHAYSLTKDPFPYAHMTSENPHAASSQSIYCHLKSEMKEEQPRLIRARSTQTDYNNTINTNQASPTINNKKFINSNNNQNNNSINHRKLNNNHHNIFHSNYNHNNNYNDIIYSHPYRNFGNLKGKQSPANLQGNWLQSNQNNTKGKDKENTHARHDNSTNQREKQQEKKKEDVYGIKNTSQQHITGNKNIRRHKKQDNNENQNYNFEHENSKADPFTPFKASEKQSQNMHQTDTSSPLKSMKSTSRKISIAFKSPQSMPKQQKQDCIQEGSDTDGRGGELEELVDTKFMGSGRKDILANSFYSAVFSSKQQIQKSQSNGNNRKQYCIISKTRKTYRPCLYYENSQQASSRSIASQLKSQNSIQFTEYNNKNVRTNHSKFHPFTEKQQESYQQQEKSEGGGEDQKCHAEQQGEGWGTQQCLEEESEDRKSQHHKQFLENSIQPRNNFLKNYEKKKQMIVNKKVDEETRKIQVRGKKYYLCPNHDRYVLIQGGRMR